MAKDTIQIGDKHYKTDTVTELAIAIMKDMRTVEEQLQSYGTQLSIAKLAKSKLIDELQKELPKMEEVEVDEAAKKTEEAK